MRTRRSTMLVAGMATIALAAALVPGASAAGRTRLAASSAPYARPASFVRSAGSAEAVRVQVYLQWRDPAGAESIAMAISTPGTPQFHHFLTPAQWASRFSATDADVAAVRSWLQGNGFHVGAVPSNHLFVPATADVATAERAFGVRLGYYRVHGQVLRAPATAPSIPSSLADVVLGVGGLAQSRAHHDAPPPPAFVVGKPCSTYWAEKFATRFPPAYGTSQPFAVCGYTPQQLQGAYGLTDVYDAGIDGSGVTVAVVDAFAAPTISTDLQTYSSRHGLPAPDFTQSNAGPPYKGPLADQQGWYGEETLDLEAVHSMAPDASLLYEGAKSDQDPDILERVNDVVVNHKAEVITNSYGSYGENLPRSDIRAEHQVYQQAAAEGISMLFSSGDDGDEIQTIGYRSTDYPGSDPIVTAVGGTSLGVGPLDNYVFETGWGTKASSLFHHRWTPKPPGDFLYGSGGGTSRIFAEPAYQQGVVPASLAGHFGGAGRVVPDVAIVGDINTGFLMGETQTFPGHVVMYGEFRIGGTSLSSPLLAGIVALVDQKAGGPAGFLNPLVYTLDPSAFHDVTSPGSKLAELRVNYNNDVDASQGRNFSLRTMNQTGTLHTKVGYDDVTGLGTPNGMTFVDDLAAAIP